MKFAGIDEAGKGPCIGPLVVCGVSINQEKFLELKLLELKDSKKLTPLKRTMLAEKIKKIADKMEIIEIQPSEIDSAVDSQNSNLNLLEAQKISEIINKLKANEVILDCPSPNKKQFVRDVQKNLTKETKIIAEHKADENYPIVSAASIIAKVTRDREIEKLKQQYDVDFGSGYMSDEITQEFLKKNWENSRFAPIIRKSWESWKKLKRNKFQMKLSKW
ncbi:ribonuclease HII [Candidatus Woesearchaeota archaeon]|nr:ribonuclease HII [Candidatus Woesearchaeota archaeon]